MDCKLRVPTCDLRAAGRRLVLTPLLCLTISGCAAHVRPTVADQFVSLNNHSLRLHFENANAPGGRPLLVYATGDGGMHRKDLDTYRHLAALGDPLVGFDARDYVKHLGGHSPTTTPERLADDYRRIITTARLVLGVDDRRPIVLVGVSRGAGLAVVAAGRLRDTIAGVVAVALTQEEEYVRWYRHLPLPRETRPPVMVDVYEYLAQLGDLPIAVVQSTHDHYLPASQAREQFGPDTAYRWFKAIDAANHSFGGARSRMYAAVREAVNWVTTGTSPAPSEWNKRSSTPDQNQNAGDECEDRHQRRRQRKANHADDAVEDQPDRKNQQSRVPLKCNCQASLQVWSSDDCQVIVTTIATATADRLSHAGAETGDAHRSNRRSSTRGPRRRRPWTSPVQRRPPTTHCPRRHATYARRARIRTADGLRRRA